LYVVGERIAVDEKLMPVDSLQKHVGMGEGDARRAAKCGAVPTGFVVAITTDRRNAAADLLQIVIRLF